MCKLANTFITSQFNRAIVYTIFSGDSGGFDKDISIKYLVPYIFAEYDYKANDVEEWSFLFYYFNRILNQISCMLLFALIIYKQVSHGLSSLKITMF